MKKLLLVILSLTLCLLLPSIAHAEDGMLEAAQKAFHGGIRNMFASELYDLLCDGDPSTDPLIISLRDPEDDARGHINGAIHYSLAELFKAETLATLPKDRVIVVYCYAGLDSSWAVGALRMLGYDAYNLFHGMSGWTTNPEIYVRGFEPAMAADYPAETEPAQATETYSRPAPLAGNVEDAARALFAAGPQYISAQELYTNLNDGNPENDPMIIDLRETTSYAAGHIPGAILMDPQTMFTEDQIIYLPPDCPIVVYRHTGQGSAKVAASLRMLGYDAYDLRFGMQSWSSDPAVATTRFDPSQISDYPTVGTLPSAVPLCEPATLPVTGGAALTPHWAIALLGLGSLLIGWGLCLRRGALAIRTSAHPRSAGATPAHNARLGNRK